jgi:hypothetical protein
VKVVDNLKMMEVCNMLEMRLPACNSLKKVCRMTIGRTAPFLGL